MTLKYSLNEDDFLQYQLYIASKSERVKKTRLKSLLWVVASFLLIAFLFFQRNDMGLVYAFLVTTLISIIFYPLYLSNHYKNHYKKFILDTYKNRFNKETEVYFEKDYFRTFDISGESKINISELDEIVEIKNHIYLRLKSGASLIMKKSEIQNIDNLKDYLRKISAELNIKYIEDLNWKWK